MNLSVFDIFLLVTPIALVGLPYLLFVRFRKKRLSKALHYAFRITLGILALWAGWLLWTAGTGDGWYRLAFLPWVFLALPVAAASLVLTWAVAVLVWPEDSPRAPRRKAAMTVIALAVLTTTIYVYRENFLIGRAMSVKTEEATLRALTDSTWARYDRALLEAIAYNKSAPVDVLERLALHKNYRIRMRVCNNQASPAKVLAILARDYTLYTRYCVAMHQNASPQLLTEMAADKDPDLRYKVAANRKTPVQVLAKLSHDSMASVRRQVAANPMTSLNILTDLSGDEDEVVRMFVARHARASSSLRLKLARDPSVRVKQALLAIADEEPELLTILSSDKDEAIRHSARSKMDYYRKKKR